MRDLALREVQAMVITQLISLLGSTAVNA